MEDGGVVTGIMGVGTAEDEGVKASDDAPVTEAENRSISYFNYEEWSFRGVRWCNFCFLEIYRRLFIDLVKNILRTSLNASQSVHINRFTEISRRIENFSTGDQMPSNLVRLVSACSNNIIKTDSVQHSSNECKKYSALHVNILNTVWNIIVVKKKQSLDVCYTNQLKVQEGFFYVIKVYCLYMSF